MNVGSGLNLVLDYADIRQFFFLGFLDGNVSGSSMCKCPACCTMLLDVFLRSALFILLYYLMLMFYACHMPSVLYGRVCISLYSSLRLDPSLSGLRHCLGSNESVE